ncbi:MAG: hypothetical protein RSG22_15730 [Comamonas sp.]
MFSLKIEGDLANWGRGSGRLVVVLAWFLSMASGVAREHQRFKCSQLAIEFALRLG